MEAEKKTKTKERALKNFEIEKLRERNEARKLLQKFVIFYGKVCKNTEMRTEKTSSLNDIVLMVPTQKQNKYFHLQ